MGHRFTAWRASRIPRGAKIVGRLSALLALCLYVVFGGAGRVAATEYPAEPGPARATDEAVAEDPLPLGDTDPAIEQEGSTESPTLPDEGDVSDPESTPVPQTPPDPGDTAQVPGPNGVPPDEPSQPPSTVAAAPPAEASKPVDAPGESHPVADVAAPPGPDGDAELTAEPIPGPTSAEPVAESTSPPPLAAAVSPSSIQVAAPRQPPEPALAVPPRTTKSSVAAPALASAATTAERPPQPTLVAAVQATHPGREKKVRATMPLVHASFTTRTAAHDVFRAATSTAIPTAGLAVAPRLPNAVAVAVEFGRAGHGWAGALVFNLWLRREMRERRMSQRKLAFLSGVNHSTISRILSDGRAPSLDTATKLAHALRLDWSDDQIAAYFDILSERTDPPPQRVETALRGDPELDEEDIRSLMNAYLVRRRRPRIGRHAP